jgi:hypothetical protein
MQNSHQNKSLFSHVDTSRKKLGGSVTMISIVHHSVTAVNTVIPTFLCFETPKYSGMS